MRLMSIASGSSGNCIYAGSEHAHLLIDAGISKKRIDEGLKEAELSGADLDGIVVTHEHQDHIAGLGVMARKYHMPIYATAGTLKYIKSCASLGKISEDLFHEIKADEPFQIKDLTIKPFRISHDANEPVGYRIENQEQSIAVATDMGMYDDYIVNQLLDLDALLIESNHDIRMLQVGPYPYYLKRRILGDRGHLSNENCGRLLSRVLHDDMKAVFLGHLSQENNYELLAYETVCSEITLGDNPYHANDFKIQVAKRSQASEMIEI